MIERKNINLDNEKNLTLGLILDKNFTKNILPIYNKSLVKTKNYQTIIDWCIDYYRKYEDTPKNTLLDIFESKKIELDEDLSDSIEKTLNYLTKVIKDSESFNSGYHLDNIVKYFKIRSLEQLKNDINTAIIDNDSEKAENIITKYKRIEINTGAGIDILRDENKIIEIFENEDENLFSIPGAFGKAMKNMYRGDLIGIGAPMKRGKTWMLMYFAIMGMLSQLKVLYWTLEMKDKIMLKRIWQSITGTCKNDLDIYELLSFEDNNLVMKDRKSEKIDLKKILGVNKKLQNQIRKGGFKLLDTTTGGLNVNQMSITLENLEYYENYTPDIIIVDYADILEPEPFSSKEERHKINGSWVALKRLAQKRNCLIFTASQMGRQTFKRDAGVDDVAEDIRKFAHVSHWLNLNQNSTEKKHGLMRVNVSGRHDDFTDGDVLIIQDLKTGRPVVDSRFVKDVKNYDVYGKEKKEDEKNKKDEEN